MAELIDSPAILEAAGQPPKHIEEYVGRVRTGCKSVSVARMLSPAGWSEPAQAPEFTEITVVLAGELQAELSDGVIIVGAGQALFVHAGERVRYSTPGADGAEYVSVCVPAFAPDCVHREPS